MYIFSTLGLMIWLGIVLILSALASMGLDVGVDGGLRPPSTPTSPFFHGASQ